MDNTQQVEIKEEHTQPEAPRETPKEAPKEAPEKAEKSEPKEVKHQSLKANLRANLRDKGDKAEPPKMLDAPQQSAPEDTQMRSLPPADMNALEKAAFLNPTAENRHILQAYYSRRTHELKADWTRKNQEFAPVIQKAKAIYDVVAPVEEEYIRKGIQPTDVIRRSLAWDKALSSGNPAHAIEFLDAYGFKVEDLLQAKQTGVYQEPQPQYLTAEEVERRVQEQISTWQQEQEQSRLALEHHNAVQSFLASDPIFKLDPGTVQQYEQAIAGEVAGLRAQGFQGSATELLNEAKKRTLALNPSFSGLVSNLNAKKEIEKSNARAEEVKRATRSIKGSPGEGIPKTKSANLRENLRKNFYK